MNNNLKNSLRTGQVINDKWVILEFIARGGMGEVYRAHQLNLKRDVVIKVISPEWLETLADNKEELETGLQRFRNEVQAMAQVRHSNIVQIYDYGSLLVGKTDEAVQLEYIVMEYIPGNTFRVTMSEEGFYPEEDLTKDWLLSYFFPVLDGVQALHDLGIVHRDLKPENILMDGNTPKIADFGLARSCRLKSVTQSLDVKGTPPYMSPEHFFDFRRADQQADVYSLGKILYETIAGKITPKMKPFQKERLVNPETPFFQKLDQIIQNSTVERKTDRLDSVNQLHKLLLGAIDILKSEIVTGGLAKPKHTSFFYSPKWIWSGVIIAVLSMIAMTFWHLMGDPGKSSLPLKKSQVSSETHVSIDIAALSDVKLPPGSSPGQSILAKDGATLHFVPGGGATIPKNFGPEAGNVVKINSFYMDETSVTNHQYVGFLNHVLPKLTIEGSVVQNEKDIWLFLGEVIEGYEPIVYRDGKFYINNMAYASLPVLRVTAYGASAYARFYGRRLPIEAEWLYALKEGIKKEMRNSEVSSESVGRIGTEKWMSGMMSEMHGQPHQSTFEPQTSSLIPSPVLDFRPNAFGIRGLSQDLGEWGMRIIKDPLKNKLREAGYVVLGWPGNTLENEDRGLSSIARHPWEAFEEVGFRCVQDVTNTKQQDIN
jgi:eukaryotic-like serine/threonine-protein kinase